MTPTTRSVTALFALLLTTAWTPTLVAQDETPGRKAPVITKASRKVVPAIDARAPKVTQTATFALG